MSEAAYTYDSARRAPPMLEELAEAVRYRDLVRQLVRRDLVARYKRSVLGMAWTMLNPLGMMVVLTVAFASVFHATRAYPVYVLVGLVAWNFFAQTTTVAMRSVAWGGVLLHRIYLPRTVFAISAAGTGLVNLVLSLVPLGAVMLATRTPLPPTVLLLPLAIALLALFTLGIGLLLSTLAVYFPDMAEMYQVALLGWMYLTPVIYPEQAIPAGYRWWLLNLNPMFHLVQFFRLSLYDGRWPSPAHVAVVAAVALAALAAGWTVFTHKADEFAYRI
jgi:ABC-2 type transport system permease protein